MNIRKILLSLVLTVCFLILPVQAQAAEVIASGTCGENLTWELTADGKLTISGTGDMEDYLEFAPWDAYSDDILVVSMGKELTSIGSYAFWNCSRLTSVTIPGGIASIGKKALPDGGSLTGIFVDENNAYYSSDEHGVLFNKNKTTLLQVPEAISGHYKIPESVTSIADAFGGCSSLISVTIPESITSIDAWAFFECSSLTSVTIPDSVTSIGYDAFRGCSSLTSVTIPARVTSIGSEAFVDCGSLTGIFVDEKNANYMSDEYGVLFDQNKETLIWAPATISGHYQIPDSVTTIGESAFSTCSNLTSVTIPRGIESLSAAEFSGCSSLKAFYVEEGNPTYYTKDGVLYALYNDRGETVHEIMQVPGGYTGVLTVPDGVTHFYGGECVCPGLTEVYLPASWVGQYRYEDKDYPGEGRNSFADCVKLTGIWVDEENETLCSTEEGVLFSKDMKILRACPPAYAGTSFEIPEGVEIIGGSAFRNCANIENLYIPASTTSIYTQNFDGCTSLMGIWVAEGNPLYMSDTYGVVYNSAYTREEYVWVELPDEEDPNDDGTMDLMDVFHPEMTQLFFFPTGRTGCYEVPEGVTELAYDSFFGANINALILPKTLDEIVDFALSSCYNLDWILCRGDCTHTVTRIDSALTVYYPADNETWSDAFDKYNSPFSNWSSAEVTYVGYSADNEPVPPYEMIQESVDNPFTDVPAEQYYYAPVLWAVENGITTGMSETSFAPDATCTRGQIVTFLWRANGSPEPKSSTNPFSDVTESDYYYKAVLWAVEKGITTGTSATTFSPDSGCTRGQVATFLWRAQGQPAPGGSNIFTDIASGAYYYDAVLWAVENGITNGMGNGTFAPEATCTRGQIVTFLYRAMV